MPIFLLPLASLILKPETAIDSLCFHQNVRGLRTKTVDFFSSVASEDFDVICLTDGLIHHPWLNPDQRLNGNLHEQANADRNDRLDVSSNWRVGEKLVWREG
ncbi:hypothetical protein AVEN_3288-1 [Araneus ventricosus]|uniref:Endonuclease/exonuclease/phosphatase domain-containing protein n=1 Tax=Araneus ventricosus TaxID=182803 RepID=A0A4Y2WI67_ARAVE|nr:hypothetical protein AVEN_3288-1 [Araneus ventricosus]